jgi:hypothetical protein
LNRSNHGNETALFLACREDRPSVVRVLLSAGADITTLNNYGQTPLAVARQRSHWDIVRMLEVRPGGGWEGSWSQHTRDVYLARDAEVSVAALWLRLRRDKSFGRRLLTARA